MERALLQDPVQRVKRPDYNTHFYLWTGCSCSLSVKSSFSAIRKRSSLLQLTNKIQDVKLCQCLSNTAMLSLRQRSIQLWGKTAGRGGDCTSGFSMMESGWVVFPPWLLRKGQLRVPVLTSHGETHYSGGFGFCQEVFIFSLGKKNNSSADFLIIQAKMSIWLWRKIRQQRQA